MRRYNANGQLGCGNKKPRLKPCPIEFPESSASIIGISAGQFHSCALNAAGETYVWGSARNGKLGSDYLEEQLQPAILTSPKMGYPIAVVCSAGGHCTVLTCANGRLLLTGFGSAVLRDATPMLRKISSSHSVLSASAGEAHCVVQLDDGSVCCFGANNSTHSLKICICSSVRKLHQTDSFSQIMLSQVGNAAMHKCHNGSQLQ